MGAGQGDYGDLFQLYFVAGFLSGHYTGSLP